MSEKKKRPAPKQKKKVFKNQDQRKIGLKAEEQFYQHYKDEGVVFGNGKNVDFINVNTKKTMELKADTHLIPEETQNMFIEKYSNKAKGTIGGVFKSLKDDVDFYCYYFMNSRRCFWFDVKTLANYIQNNEDNLRTKIVFNKGYDTEGLLLPIEEVEDLILRDDKFSDK